LRTWLQVFRFAYVAAGLQTGLRSRIHSAEPWRIARSTTSGRSVWRAHAADASPWSVALLMRSAPCASGRTMARTTSTRMSFEGDRTVPSAWPRLAPTSAYSVQSSGDSCDTW